jgi:dTDP-glucose pyrophosphorylase/predicted transcriptional regulator
MTNWKEILIQKNATIHEAIKKIDSASLQIVLVVDRKGRLLGTVTDGDIRRGILKGLPYDEPVVKVMNSNPTTTVENVSKVEMLKLMQDRQVARVPILDGKGQVVGVEILDELIKPKTKENIVVLMAGGVGTRLKPLTNDCPKPMLEVKGKPILEIILNNFIDYEFRKFHISVNYKADVIEKYFGDGSKWGVEISYIREEQKMGTIGSLSLLTEKPREPLIVMNGDVLTNINLDQLLAFHNGGASAATLCVRDYVIQIPFGAVEIKDHKILEIKEKPEQHFFVNAGIYVFEPCLLELIPQDTYYDMDTLVQKIIETERGCSAFPIREYWLDIGQIDDYKKGNREF